MLLCGVVEGVLPKTTGKEVQYTSQLYVGLTRSEDALLIGVAVGDQELGDATFLPQSLVHDRVVSRYLRFRFEHPGEMLSLCRWSDHSVCPLEQMVWFPEHRYAPHQPGGSSSPKRIRTVDDWAAVLRPEQLLATATATGLRFARNLTHHPGMLAVQAASLEGALGRLAEHRLQAAFRRLVAGDVRVEPAGARREGWHAAAQRWLPRDPAVAGAIEWARRFCGEGGEAIASADPGLSARQLWCLALVDLAEIHNDPDSVTRPSALSAAAELHRGAGAGLTGTPSTSRCRLTSTPPGRWSASGTASARPPSPRPSLGASAASTAPASSGAAWAPHLPPGAPWSRWWPPPPPPPAAPPPPSRSTSPGSPPRGGPGHARGDAARRLLGRHELGYRPPAAKRPRRSAPLVVEIPEETPPRRAATRVLLHAGMLEGTRRALVVDVTRGAQWECPSRRRRGAALLKNAEAVVEKQREKKKPS